MRFIEDLDELHLLYGTPGETSLRKVANKLTPEYRNWILRSRFCILTTVGPEGTDGTPRGDDGPVVTELDPGTLALPDWHGNNRIDSLRNIVRDPRVSLLFMVHGSNNVVRINGEARVSADTEVIKKFARGRNLPRSVIVVKIAEVYGQCARALVRSRLWGSGDESEGLPTIGQILSSLTDGQVGGQSYDEEWAGRAAKSLW